MWIIEFFIETIVKDSELISLPFTAEIKNKVLTIYIYYGKILIVVLIRKTKAEYPLSP